MTREQILLESLKKLCKAEGIQIYSTMSETKAAFAECTIGSLKSTLYRYMEDNGYKHVHKMTQFVTKLNSRKNCSIDLIPKLYRIPTFFPFCTANHYENLENPSLKLEKEFASPSMTYPSGRVISHSLQKKFSKICDFFQKTSNIHNKGSTRRDYPR